MYDMWWYRKIVGFESSYFEQYKIYWWRGNTSEPVYLDVRKDLEYINPGTNEVIRTSVS